MAPSRSRAKQKCRQKPEEGKFHHAQGFGGVEGMEATKPHSRDAITPHKYSELTVSCVCLQP